LRQEKILLGAWAAMLGIGLREHHQLDIGWIAADAPSNRTEEADGMITDVPGLALNLRVADCQSFVIFSPKKNVLGLLHVGWRGLISGAIPEFFAVLTNHISGWIYGEYHCWELDCNNN
jgi:copper oxidase (laccase) domain-containing protein